MQARSQALVVLLLEGVDVALKLAAVLAEVDLQLPDGGVAPMDTEGWVPRGQAVHQQQQLVEQRLLPHWAVPTATRGIATGRLHVGVAGPTVERVKVVAAPTETCG